MLHDSFLTDEQTLLRWIELIHAQGIRRPGYPADRWAEQFCRDQFAGSGARAGAPRAGRRCRTGSCARRRCIVESRRRTIRDPVLCPAVLDADTRAARRACRLRRQRARRRCAARLSLYDVTLLRLPPAFTVLRRMRTIPASRRTRRPAARAGGLPLRSARHIGTDAPGAAVRARDPARHGAVDRRRRRGLRRRAAAAIRAVAVSTTCRTMASARPIPGVWIGDADGARLHALLDAGPVQVELRVDAALRRDHFATTSSASCRAPTTSGW